MADEDFLSDRRRSLEEAFFAKQTEQLKRKLRDKETAALQREELSAASGIGDEKVLDALIARGIDARAVAALALVPLVEVAWADGKIDAKERDAVLRAAGERGVQPGSPGLALLESWLGQRPDQDVLAAWKDYVRALCAKMEAAERDTLKRDLVGRARAIAEAAGGFLGLGGKVSAAEERVLADLESSFLGG